MLATLTPSEYAEIRPFLATSSGFQSWQYRAVEFLLGNKNPEMVQVFGHDPTARDLLEGLLHEPSLYDEFLRYLHRRGYAVPAELLERDWSQPYQLHDGLVDVFAGVYAAPDEHWGVYETCEELVDVEDNFQEWRFRHLQVVTPHHRPQDRYRRLVRGRLPAPGARPHLLSRAVCRPHQDRVSRASGDPHRPSPRRRGRRGRRVRGGAAMPSPRAMRATPVERSTSWSLQRGPEPLPSMPAPTAPAPTGTWFARPWRPRALSSAVRRSPTSTRASASSSSSPLPSAPS